MAKSEAQARIKINKLLEESGWRFFNDKNGKANIVLEPQVKLKPAEIESLGKNFEKTKKGCVKVAHPEKCIGCLACETNCPENAIKVK